MALIKGAIRLTRYLVIDQPPDLTDEYLTERLQDNAFVSIEQTTEEESVGWVEILDPLNMDFPPTSWRFGPLIAMSLRVDTRKLSNKVLKRYLTMAAAQAESDTGKPLSTRDRQELKHRVREELLSRTPVNTDVYEVGWFPEAAEVWLVGAGSAKVRERFEEWWRHTFNLGLIMKIPFVQARIKGPEGAEDALDRLRPSALFGGGED